MVPSGVWATVGALLVAAGLVVNEVMLAALFSADGELAARNRWIVRAGQIAIVGLGWLIITLRRRIRAPVAGIAALCCSVVLSPLLAEVALRTVFGVRNVVMPPTRRMEALLGWQTIPDHQVSGFHRGYGDVRYSTGKYGFRVFGDPGRDAFRVLVLGDSSTEATQVSDGETYYDVMAALCPELEVFAYGAGGYGSLQEYIVLDAFIDRVDPQLIVWQFDWNDLINNSFQWETMSRLNNNLMTRPYVVDGEIELRFPVQTGRGPLLQLVQSSYLMRLMRVTGRRMVTGDEPEIGTGHPVFEGAVASSRVVMEWARDRAGDRPMAAFCLCPPGGDPHAEVYRAISRDLGIHYLSEALVAVDDAKAAGEVVTGVEDGVEVDSHLNARGHRLLGESLATSLDELGLIPCTLDGS